MEKEPTMKRLDTNLFTCNDIDNELENLEIEIG